MAYFPDANTLAKCSYDTTILLWYVKIGQQKAKLNLDFHCVYLACFLSDSSKLVSGGDKENIYILDFQTALLDNKYKNTFKQIQKSL
ncbi:unnamed protein product [Paramecium octaurelia]|uniref:Uncharacterized protein n=1 Tax=Paramecium octaurelia TaxID=43137 RepID=A0A8S1YFC3_PAROT|nr:unnamed protein product [Paramecium octaurelia]